MKKKKRLLLNAILFTTVAYSIIAIPNMWLESGKYRFSIGMYFLESVLIIFSITQFIASLKLVEPKPLSLPFWGGISIFFTLVWGMFIMAFEDYNYSYLILIPFFVISSFISLQLYIYYHFDKLIY